MPLTRAWLEDVVIRKAGGANGVMARAGLDTTASGANRDLDAPFWEAMMAVGVTPISPPDVADADIAAVPYSRLRQLADMADLTNCRNILAVLRRIVTQQRAPDLINLTDMANGLARDIAYKQSYIDETYGQGMSDFYVAPMAPGPNPPDATCVPRPWHVVPGPSPASPPPNPPTAPPGGIYW